MEIPPAMDRAAYSASQPLYDALRTVVNRVDQSRQLLEAAMLQVRNEHVKAKSDQVLYGATSQEQYIDLSVTAWRGITDAFTTVFSELSSLTEPNMSEGRTERPGHKLISTLHQTTIAANCAAHAFPILSDHGAGLDNQQGTTGHKHDHTQYNARQQTTDGALPSEEASQQRSQSSHGIKRVAKRVASTSSLKQEHSSKVRVVEGDASTAPHQKPAVHVPKRPKTNLPKSNPTIVQKKLETLDLGNGGPKKTPAQPYEVQYEDVSAEVEARLRAKDALRRETKGDMKRKRTSAQSFDSLIVDSVGVPPTYGQSRRKRARQRKSGENLETNASATWQSVKRDSPLDNSTGSKRAKLSMQG